MRLRTQRGVADDAELHTAAVAQNRDPQTDGAGLRHPEQALFQRGTAELQLFARPWHIGHDGRGFLREQAKHGVLRRLDQKPGHCQQTKSQKRLHAALHFTHASAHLVDPLNRVFNADRQHDRRQTKTVTQFVGLLQRPQIDRHHGTDLLAGNLIAKLLQILSDGASDTTQQNIIDRAIQGLANRLDFLQRDRLAPRHPFAGTRGTLEPGWRIVRHERQSRTVAQHLIGQFGQFQ